MTGVVLKESASPGTPAAGFVNIYAKSDGLLYFKDDGGTEQQVALGTAASPTGTIVGTGRSTAPTGWLLCDGAAVSRTTFATLFADIGTAYGVGDGSTTFNVPDGRGRSLLGAGTGTVVEAVTASSANGFTVAANNDKWHTGMTVVLSNLATFTTTATAGPTYYAVRVSSTNVRLATTLALAQNGTPDITISGTGTATLTHTYTARTLGEYGGKESHAMTSTELLSHFHTITPNVGNAIASGGDYPDGNSVGAQALPPSDSKGGNAAMNIRGPFFAGNWIIKT